MKRQLKNNKCGKQEAYDILHEYITQEIALVKRNEINEDSFDSPNWSHKAAYYAGMLKMATKIKQFVPDKGK